MARYIIFGAGRQGQALAYFLAQSGGAELITLSDCAQESAQQAVEQLRMISNSKTNSVFVAVRADARDLTSSVRLIKNHDICISALPHEYNLFLTEAAFRAGRHYLDFGFDTEIIRKQLKDYHQKALRKNITMVPNNGVGPGLTNIIAYQGAKRVDCDTVKVYSGGLPLSPNNALRYEELFSNLLYEYIGDQVIVRDGKLISMPVPSENEEILIEGFQEPLEAFLTNTATSLTAEQFYAEGRVKNFCEKTIRYPGHYQIIKAIAELGFLSTTPHEVNGKTFIPLEVSKKLFSTYLPKCQQDTMVLSVVFEKQGQLIQRVAMRADYDPITKFTAMQILTSVPVAIVAQMIMAGEIPSGVHLPEMVVDYERMLNELSKIEKIKISFG